MNSVVRKGQKRAEALRGFDAEFYLLVNPDLQTDANKTDLHHHFDQRGWKELRDPSLEFSTRHYLQANPDVAKAQINPFRHYVVSGRRENRPSAPPLFDPLFYGNSNLGTDVDPKISIEHYCKDGRKRGLSPNPIFDISFYRRQVSEKIPADFDDLAHYLQIGWRLGLSPHPLFDIKYYASQLPERARLLPPLAHYWSIGWRVGHSPHPLFDPDYYRKHGDGPSSDDVCPFAHYLTRKEWNSAPHYLFSDAYYLGACSQKLGSKTRIKYRSGPPLLHYVTIGARKGVPPHPLFDPIYYRGELLKSARAACRADQIDPDAVLDLLHYINVGSDLGVSPSPYFVPDYYRKEHADAIAGDPLRHYLGEGGFRAASPHPGIDLHYYKQVAANFDDSKLPSILHLLATARSERVSPHPAFDPEFYLKANGDLRDRDQCPILHFLAHGLRENRNPNGLFSSPYVHLALAHGQTGFCLPVYRYFDRKMYRRPRILFLGHDGSRTGAPLILLNIVRYISQTLNFECFAILGKGGDLVDEFHKYAHTSVIKNADRNFLDGYRHSDAFLAEIDELIGALGSNLPILTICNSVEARHLADAFSRQGIGPIVSLVHEAADSYEPRQIYDTFDLSALVIVPSKYVLDRAERIGALPQEKIAVRGQGLLTAHFGESSRDVARARVCRELKVPSDARIVLGCGTVDRRKGFDIFVEAACRLLREEEVSANVHFVWVGEGASHYDSARYWGLREIKEHGLENRIHLVGSCPDPEPYFLAADLFTLPSRVDPYPCVVHEAMSCSLPVIAFEGMSGAPELFEKSGVVVAPGTEPFTEAIRSLLSDARRRMELGTLARKIIQKRGNFADYVEDLLALIRDRVGVANLAPRKNQNRRHKAEKLVYFSAADWQISGVNTFTERLVERLNKSGFDARILFTRGRFTFHRDTDRNHFPSVPYQYIEPRFDDAEEVWRALLEHVRSNRQHCIYVPNYDYIASAVCPILPERVGIVGIVHSDDVEHYEHVHRLGLYWDRIVCVSNRIRDQVLSDNASLSEKTSVIRYGVRFDDVAARAAVLGRNARKPGDPIRLVYAGRFVEHQKRIMNYVKLARLLARAGVPFTLTMIGDGDLFDRVRAELRDLVAAGCINLPGRLPPEAVTRAFGEADVFLLLSDFEGLPLSLLEALSLGCVPVTWNLDSGVPEIIADTKNGFVLPIGDFDGVVRRISILQNDRDLLKEVSRASLESFKMHRLDETTMADAYATLFEATLHETRNRTKPRHPSLSLYEGGVLPPTWLAGVRHK